MNSKNFKLQQSSRKFIYGGTALDKTAHCMLFSIEANNPTKVKQLMDTPDGQQAIMGFLDECQESLNRFRAQFTEE